VSECFFLQGVKGAKIQCWIQGLIARGQGQGLEAQGQGQGPEVQGQEQGQGLVNCSSRTRTRTFLEDNNTGLQRKMAYTSRHQ